VGGCCPKGRLAEDGAVPETYPLTELKSASYPARTEKNVKDSDGTLVLNIGKLAGGTKKTVECMGSPAWWYNWISPARPARSLAGYRNTA